MQQNERNYEKKIDATLMEEYKQRGAHIFIGIGLGVAEAPIINTENLNKQKEGMKEGKGRRQHHTNI